MTNLEVIILSPELEQIGLVNKMTALRWTERFHGFGDFELWLPLTEENAGLMREDNLVWIGTSDLGVIETIQKAKDNDGSLSLQVSGRFNECWLERRVVWSRYSETGYVSNHMRNLVYDNAVNPALSGRRIPHMVLSETQEVQGPSVSYTAHRDNLWTSLDDLGKVHNVSPRLVNDVPAQTVTFVVQGRTDRTIEQTAVPPVVLSSELSDILSSDYSSDNTGFRNTALVAGAGEGEARKEHTVNPGNTGLNRREMSVDARDLSDTEPWNRKTTTVVSIDRTYYDDNGNVDYYKVRTTVTKVLTHPVTGETRTTTSTSIELSDIEPVTGTTVEEDEEEVLFPTAVYNSMLNERGLSYLAENLRVEAFNSQVRMTGARAYTYGEDYFLGDRITVQDLDLLIQISTDITEVEQTWDEESYSVALTLGDSAPTIKQLIRKRR